MDLAAPHSESLEALETKPRPALGELLTRDGLVTEDQLDDALREGAETGERLGEVVVRHGWASEEDVARLLAEQWQLSYVDRASIWFDSDAPARMSRSEAKRLEVLPTRVENGNVVVAVAEPTEQRLAALREVIGEQTVVIVVPKSALEAGLSSQLLAGDQEPEPAAASVSAAPEPEPGHEQPPPVERAPAPPLLRAITPHDEPADEPHAEADRPLAPRVHEGEPELAELLAALHETARDAVALQRHATELAQRLEGVAGELESVAERIVQRTELTDRLKAQLHDLTRTLDTLQ